MKIISKNKEIRYEQVTTDNMDLAFNIQKNEWKDNPDKENFLDKAINAKKIMSLLSHIIIMYLLE